MKKTFSIFAVLAALISGCLSSEETAQAPAPSPSGSAPLPSASLAVTEVIPNTNAALSWESPIRLKGRGFSSTMTVLIGGQIIEPTSVTPDEILIPYQPGLFPDGAVTVTVASGDGKQVSLERAFFNFSSPLWETPGDSVCRRVHDLDIRDGLLYLATPEGLLTFSDSEGFKQVMGRVLDECRPPSANDTQPVDEPSLTAIHAVESDGGTGIHVVTESSGFDPARMLWSSLSQNSAWIPIEFFDGLPLALKKKEDSLYLLTSEAIYVQVMGGWTPVIALSQELKARVSPPGFAPPGIFSFEPFEDAEDLHFFIGTPQGLYTSRLHKSTQTQTPWVLVGPEESSVGLPITGLALDPVNGILYFSFIPQNSTGPYGNGAIGRMQVGSVDWSIQSHLPWIYDLAWGEDRLLALGWSPLSKDRDSILYEISDSGTASHLYSRFKTLGLPSLPSSLGEVVTDIHFQDGLFFAYLESRRCILESDGVPGQGSPIRCLGGEKNLIERKLNYLFIQNGVLSTSTDQGTFSLNDSSKDWEASSLTADESFRQDTDFSSISDGDGIAGPLLCALEIPELDLRFVCSSQSVFTSFKQGPWTKLGSASAFMTSLAYRPDEGLLYGASTAQGLFKMPIP